MFPLAVTYTLFYSRLSTHTPHYPSSQMTKVQLLRNKVSLVKGQGTMIMSALISFSLAWAPGYVYNTSYTFRMATEDITEPQPTVPVGSIAIYWRR